jgi:hypothetical protein
MTYYTHHRKTDVHHYVSAYVSSDYLLEQMPSYTHHRKMRAFQYVHKAPHSQHSGKKDKIKILTYTSIIIMSFKAGVRLLIITLKELCALPNHIL